MEVVGGNIKGKKGFQKGLCANPKGRPVGSKNNVPNDIKMKAQRFLNDGFEKFIETMGTIEDPIQKSKLFLETCKTFLPRPKDEEEVEEEKRISEEFMRRLFPDRYKDSE
jgi:hypothetical protein